MPQPIDLRSDTGTQSTPVVQLFKFFEMSVAAATGWIATQLLEPFLMLLFADNTPSWLGEEGFLRAVRGIGALSFALACAGRNFLPYSGTRAANRSLRIIRVALSIPIILLGLFLFLSSLMSFPTAPALGFVSLSMTACTVMFVALAIGAYPRDSSLRKSAFLNHATVLPCLLLVLLVRVLNWQVQVATDKAMYLAPTPEESIRLRVAAYPDARAQRATVKLHEIWPHGDIQNARLASYLVMFEGAKYPSQIIVRKSERGWYFESAASPAIDPESLSEFAKYEPPFESSEAPARKRESGR